ncbi:hypothetical protein [Kurthia huakuii]|uniref:hypothetical protein n=1 Tax=Kurthia huakuii TaxID=1421019 RepID=UPI00049641C0|nr:hypothetical protein [Kurthia huakuii]MBM7699409.1 hypothetical protein [Kurthia huakuii]
MKYTANAQRSLILCLALLCLLLGTLNKDISILKWTALAMCIICILMSFISYSFWIKKSGIAYEMRIFSIKIYAKNIEITDIEKIIFKRSGWKAKSAIIQLNKGPSIRVSLFKPTTVYQDLILFCEENTVRYELSESYKFVRN